MDILSFSSRIRRVLVGAGVGMFVFSLLVAVPQPVAAADEFESCTGPTLRDTCADGLSCRSNPWRTLDATDPVPPGVPGDIVTDDTVTSICCDTVWGCVNADQVQAATGLGDSDPRETAARVINVILGFLGIIAVVLILAGGFMWMTAAGNDDKIGTAKKIMSAGVIGLVIVLAAFGIAQFVVNALVTATT